MSEETHAGLVALLGFLTAVLVLRLLWVSAVDWFRYWSDPPEHAKTYHLIFGNVTTNRTKAAFVLFACALLLLIVVDSLAPPPGASE